MPLIHIFLMLLIVGVICALFWFGLNAIPGLPPWIKTVLILIAILMVLLWLAGGGRALV